VSGSDSMAPIYSPPRNYPPHRLEPGSSSSFASWPGLQSKVPATSNPVRPRLQDSQIIPLRFKLKFGSQTKSCPWISHPFVKVEKPWRSSESARLAAARRPKTSGRPATPMAGSIPPALGRETGTGCCNAAAHGCTTVARFCSGTEDRGLRRLYSGAAGD